MTKLNCDMGESFGIYRAGNDEEIMPLIDVANVACGFHASDPNHMRKTVELAKKHNVKVGAHPSFPDLQGFGRREMKMPKLDLKNNIRQILNKISKNNFDTSLHNLLELNYINKLIIPLPYDFDMTGWVNPSYQVVNETLNISSVKDRKYRGFKRDVDVFNKVRDQFISYRMPRIIAIRVYLFA